MNIDELVDNILLTRDPAFNINDEIRDVELENFISDIFESYQKFDKDIIQKIYNIATHPKFKYWIDCRYSDNDNYHFIWHPISINNCSLIEIEKQNIMNAVLFATRYHMDMTLLKHPTPLDWLAYRLTFDAGNYRKLYSDVFQSHLSNICYNSSYRNEQTAEYTTRFTKVLFAVLDMSVPKKFNPSSYQKIQW